MAQHYIRKILQQLPVSISRPIYSYITTTLLWFWAHYLVFPQLLSLFPQSQKSVAIIKQQNLVPWVMMTMGWD